MSKTLIRIGHSAYRGSNSMRLCFSKSQAVRVLRNRGVKRDDARRVVNKATATPYSGACANGEHDSAIEVTNEAYSYNQGHFMRSYEEMKKLWSSASEL